MVPQSQRWQRGAAYGLVALSVLVLAAPRSARAAPAPITAELTLEPKGALKLPYYFPVPIELSGTRPDGIKKEPAYKGTPKYAVLHIGTGAPFFLALDEPEVGDYHIYLDANHNGDLTDDGNGAWASKKDQGMRTVYGPNEFMVDASWTGPDGKVTNGQYGLAIYRLKGARDGLFCYRQAARTGTITVAGKPHKAILVDNETDGIYSKPAVEGMPLQGRPIQLLIDLNDDGIFDPRPGAEAFDVRMPFKLAGQAYEANVSLDGSHISLVPTTKVVADIPAPPVIPQLLKVGTTAPDFAAEALGGGTLSLAKYKGKVVILDFWATWCGPCQASMPHLEQVYEKFKSSGLVVLGLCVRDKKEAYEKWVPAHPQYTFTLGFDPKGTAPDSIPDRLYGVNGIPCTYIIDKDGKVADTIVGYGENDHRIEEALGKLGLKL